MSQQRVGNYLIRMKVATRDQNKSEGVVYYENNSETWNVVFQYKVDGAWHDVPLVFVDPDYVGEGEKAHRVG